MGSQHDHVVTVVASGLGFTEGPVILRNGNVLVTSVTLGKLFVLDPAGNVSSIDTGNAPNGATEGADGRIFVAQTGGSSPIGAGGELGREGGVQVVATDGSVSWLTTEPTSPNDICIGPDGWVYCTDPTRPMGSNSGRLWRSHPATGETQQLAEMPWYPNGIGFGLEDDALFVAHTQARQILRYPLHGGRLGEPKVVIQMDDGHPDGFAFDTDGNLLIAGVQFENNDPASPDPLHRPGTLQRWTPDGMLLDVVRPGSAAVYANVAIAADGTLYVTGSAEGTVLRIDGCNWPGLPLHPFR